MTGPTDEVRPDLQGDEYDPEPLLTAREVSEILRVPRKSVYGLPIPRVRIGLQRVRWRPATIRKFIEDRTEKP